MIAFSKYRGYLIKWACLYVSYYPQFEIDELVNEGWLRLHNKLNNPSFIPAATRYAIKDYIRTQRYGRRKRPLRDYAIHDKAYDNFWDVVTDGLDRTDRLIVKLRYIEGFRPTEIAKVIGLKYRAIYERHRKIISRLQNL